MGAWDNNGKDNGKRDSRDRNNGWAAGWGNYGRNNNNGRDSYSKDRKDSRERDGGWSVDSYSKDSRDYGYGRSRSKDSRSGGWGSNSGGNADKRDSKGWKSKDNDDKDNDKNRKYM